MVNTTNVRSLLLRLHQETQPAASATASVPPSFASSLGSVIVTAGDGQSINSQTPILHRAEGTAATGTVSEEKGSGGVAVMDRSPVPAAPSEVSADLKAAAMPRSAMKYLMRSEPVSEGHESKSFSPVISADEESKPIGKTDKAKVQKAERREGERESLNVATGAVPAPVTAEVAASQQAMATAPSVVAALVSQHDPMQLLSDVPSGTGIRNSTSAVTTKVDSAMRTQVGSKRTTSLEQKTTTRSAKGEIPAAPEKHEDAPVNSSAPSSLPSHSTQVLKQVAEHADVVQSISQPENLHTSLQASHMSASQIPLATATSHAEKRDAVPVSLTQSFDAPSPAAEVGVRFQSGMGSRSAGERLIAMTPSSLEVGLSHETHGWLKVRAEMTDTGTVAATLSSTSTTGEQMLHRELPSISSFINGEQLTSTSLVVHSSSEVAEQFTGMDGGAAGGQAWSGSHDSPGNNRGDSMTSGDTGILLEEGFEDLHDDWGRPGSGWLSIRA